MVIPTSPEFDSLKKGTKTLSYPRAHRNSGLSLTYAGAWSVVSTGSKQRSECLPVTPQLTPAVW